MKIITKLLELDNEASERLRIKDENSAQFLFAGLVAHSGDSWLWCGILFIIWLFVHGDTERIIAWWGGCIALTALLVFMLKKLIPRQRPKGEWGEIYRKGDPHSFPSGHAVRGGLIIVLAFTTFRNPWIIAAFVVWALIMIASRVMTGVHFPLDVLAGLALGLLFGWLFTQLQPWIFETFAIIFDKSQWI